MTKKHIRRIIKVLMWIILVMLLLFAIFWGLLQLSPVQNWAVKQVTTSLSNSLGTNVSINHVDLKFFKTIHLQGVFAADQKGDTLIYTDQLNAQFKLFDYLKGDLLFDEIAIKGGRVNLKNTPVDSIFNFQFIIDGFKPDPTILEPKKKSGKVWNFDLDKLSLEQTQIAYHDIHGGTIVDGQIGSLQILVDELDFGKSIIQLDKIDLNKSDIRVQLYPAPENEESINNPFPNLGIELYAKQFDIKESNFELHNDTLLQLPNQLDPNHLEFEDLDLKLIDFAWVENEMSFEILEGSMIENNGLVIEKMATKYRMTPKLMSFENLFLKTLSSDIQTDFSMSYDNLKDLSDFENLVQLNARIDHGDISYNDLTFLAPQLSQSALNTDAREHFFVKGNLTGTISNLRASRLQLKIGDRFNSILSGSIIGLPDVERLKTNLTFQELSTSYDDLQSLTKDIELPDGIQRWGKIKLSGSLSGNTEKFIGENIQISTIGSTRFNGDFSVENLNDISNFKFNAEVKSLTTNADEIRGFSKSKLPSAIDSLGVFSLQGNFNGTAYDFYLDGKLLSEAGDVDTDLAIEFTDDYKNATYKGKIGMDDFDLGRVVGDQMNIGLLSLDIDADGEGLTMEDLKANVKGHVRSMIYKGYQYEDFNVDGRFIGQKFLGVATIHDRNIDLAFDGQIDLSGPEPDFIFDTQIDTLDLFALNLVDDSLSLSGRVQANFVGGNVDAMEGFIHLSDAHITNRNGTYYDDRISVFSNIIKPTQREFNFKSDIGQITVKGDYSLLELPEVMYKYVDNYFPLHHLIPSFNYVDAVSLDTLKSEYQSFTFDLLLSNPIRLTQLFFPGLTRLDTGFVKGRIDTRLRQLDLEGMIPGLIYSGTVVDTIRLESIGAEVDITNELKLQDIDISPTLQIPEAVATFDLRSDSAFFEIVVKSDIDSVGDKFLWGGNASANDVGYVYHMNSPLLLNGVHWNIDPDNEVLFAGNDFEIHQMNLYKPGQEILISTIEKDVEDQVSPIEIGFRQFRLAEISNLLERNQESFYDGKINGNVLLRNATKELSFLADLVVEQLTLNDQLVGTAIVSAEQKADERIDLEIDLFGEQNDMHVEGSYIIEDSELDMIADVKKLELRLIDPFMETLVHESQGSLSGSLDITGPAISPEIEGNVTFNEASTVVDFLNIRYSIPRHVLHIKNKKVDFGALALVDPSGNIATVTGDMTYVRLDDIRFNLNLNTDRFQIINTTAADNELFYGKIFMAGNGSIRGNTEKPIINTSARTAEGTEFVVQPLTYEQSLAQEDFIIFANPELYQEDTTITLNDLYKLSGVGVDLTANIEITPDAQLEIVLDPATGDKLVCRGQSDLVVQMNPTGDISILGNYTLTSGQYTLVFQGVLKKVFEIEPGSTVTFIGDPLKSKFNVNAKHEVRASPYALIAGQSTTLSGNAKKKVDVNVTMSITGDLESPVIDLDIIIPENENTNSDLGGAVSTRLAGLRENESDLNKQVFGLLIFSSFLESDNSGANLPFTNVGLSAVSSILTDQLNLLADRYIKGVDLDFGIDSYKSGLEGETITEIGVGISKNFLDDRLKLKLGGNVNNSSEQLGSAGVSDNSTFSGDFVLEYKLNEKGNYQLRFYQVVSSEKNILNPGANNSETGIAIFFTKSFNSKKYKLKLKDDGLQQ